MGSVVLGSVQLAGSLVSLLTDSSCAVHKYPLAHDQASAHVRLPLTKTVNVSPRLHSTQATLAIWPFVRGPVS